MGRTRGALGGRPASRRRVVDGRRCYQTARPARRSPACASCDRPPAGWPLRASVPVRAIQAGP